MLDMFRSNQIHFICINKLFFLSRHNVVNNHIDKFVESCTGVCPSLSVCLSLTAKVPNVLLLKRKGKRPCQLCVGRQYYSLQSTTYPDCSFCHQHLPCLYVETNNPSLLKLRNNPSLF